MYCEYGTFFMNNRTTLRKRTTFLESISADSAFYQLFDHLPGISFFAKNEKFELVCANHAFLERLGFQSEGDIIGKTDFELFPRSLAKHFRIADDYVLTTGKPKLNIVELFINTLLENLDLFDLGDRNDLRVSPKVFSYSQLSRIRRN